MKRRLFVKASIPTTSIASVIPDTGKSAIPEPAAKNEKQEFYELRTYSFKSPLQSKKVEEYFEKAAIPALNRLGSRNVGVFTNLKPEAEKKLYVIIPFQSMDDFLKVETKLFSDNAFMQAGADYLNAPATEPAYDRIESSLLRAFIQMPKLELPQKKPRIFELRRYESASETAGQKKIEMFNQAGEINISKRVGLTPVFFGETLIGQMIPNLTYMLTYDDMAEHDRNWKVFGSDPEWKKISGMPEYADAKIVSRIASTFLVPTAFSQI